MARLGIAPHVADKILNHQSGAISGVAAVYQRHEFLIERKEALQLWAAHLAGLLASAPIVQNDLQRRYSYFLDFLANSGRLDMHAAAGRNVTPEKVSHYVQKLTAGVSSVTAHGSVYKLRRAAMLIAPQLDLCWLSEIDKDLALVAYPRSKFDRLVLTEVLVEAGKTLCAEAELAMHKSPLARALLYRDGLMMAMLAMHPIRLKNFASLTLGKSMVNIEGTYWIVLAGPETKEGRPDEREVDPSLLPLLERYLEAHRPALQRGEASTSALWITSNTGGAMSYSAIGRRIKQVTLRTVGVDLSPHLFRTSASSSCAVHAGHLPHLSSALLHHADKKTAEAHYNRATTFSASRDYATLIASLERPTPVDTAGGLEATTATWQATALFEVDYGNGHS